ncbi:MAG: T9SS type A sorting domain-containing protein, partial [Bacteroidota bacterium]|nr:T9SS type A sorting domain-containing protein [Bacteroidota bacterium]
VEAYSPDEGSIIWTWSIADSTASQSWVELGANDYLVTVTSSNGCFNSDSMSISGLVCTGVHELNGVSNVFLFPNPANSEIIIQASGHLIAFELLDLRSKVVTRKQVQGDIIRHSVKDLSPGMYLLHAMLATGESQVLRFVKE